MLTHRPVGAVTSILVSSDFDAIRAEFDLRSFADADRFPAPAMPEGKRVEVVLTAVDSVVRSLKFELAESPEAHV